jgi:hypothetical protein
MKNSRPLAHRLTWLTIWGVAFGLIEAAVVVYLRKIYYPDGFSFPVVIASTDISTVELIREFATIVIMWAVAELSYRSFQARLAVFMILFGVWDVIYYIALKLFIAWPESLATWDVLFLLPSPWVGPVWAPMFIAVSLVLAGVLILKRVESGHELKVNYKFWIFEIAMGIIIISSFLIPGQVVLKTTVPDVYPWYLLLAGYIPGLGLFLYQFQKK